MGAGFDTCTIRCYLCVYLAPPHHSGLGKKLGLLSQPWNIQTATLSKLRSLYVHYQAVVETLMFCASAFHSGNGYPIWTISSQLITLASISSALRIGIWAPAYYCPKMETINLHCGRLIARKDSLKLTRLNQATSTVIDRQSRGGKIQCLQPPYLRLTLRLRWEWLQAGGYVAEVSVISRCTLSGRPPILPTY